MYAILTLCGELHIEVSPWRGQRTVHSTKTKNTSPAHRNTGNGIAHWILHI